MSKKKETIMNEEEMMEKKKMRMKDKYHKTKGASKWRYDMTGGRMR